MPHPEDISLEGLEDEVTPETLKQLLTVDPAQWKAEVADIKTHYAKFGDKLPHELSDCLKALEDWVS